MTSRFSIQLRGLICTKLPAISTTFSYCSFSTTRRYTSWNNGLTNWLAKLRAMIFIRCCDIVTSCSTIAAEFCLLTASLFKPVDNDDTELVSSFSSCSRLSVWKMNGLSGAWGIGVMASGRVTFTRPPTLLSKSSRGLDKPPFVIM